MTNFTLGRIGLDADIDDVSQWDANGEVVSVSWSTPSIGEGGSVERSNAYRQMLLGYARTMDQRFVPVTWADHPNADGYYRVLRGSVVPDPDLGLDGLYYFTAELERVQGFGMPAIETTYLYHTRTNVYGLIGTPLLACPFAAQWDYTHESVAGTYSNAPTQYSVGSETGTVRIVHAGAVGGSGPSGGDLSTWVRQIPPADYYDGAVCIETNGYCLEGRQVPRDGFETWHLSNGLIDIGMSAAGLSGDDAEFEVRSWNGSAWADATAFGLLGDGTTSPRNLMLAPESITILKNSAEEINIRLTLRRSGKDYPHFLDIGLRRGMRFFTFRYRRASGTGSTIPGVVFPDMFDVGWSNGAWVHPGILDRTSYAWNPRAEIDSTNWAAYIAGTYSRLTGLTVGSTGVSTGGRATATGAHVTTGFGVIHGDTASGANTPNGPLSAGTTYSIGAYVRCSVARSLTLTASWRNNVNGQISTSAATVAVAANTWTQVKIEGVVAPAGTTRVAVRVAGNSGGAAWTAGDTVGMTALQIENAATLSTTYWDGNTATGGTNAHLWTTDDAPNTSSLKYPRSGQPLYWLASPEELVQDVDGYNPPTSDPTSWDFGIGLVYAGITGDPARQDTDILGYQSTITMSDEVVAV